MLNIRKKAAAVAVANVYQFAVHKRAVINEVKRNKFKPPPRDEWKP
jgi:hypothetical protein